MVGICMQTVSTIIMFVIIEMISVIIIIVV